MKKIYMITLKIYKDNELVNTIHMGKSNALNNILYGDKILNYKTSYVFNLDYELYFVIQKIDKHFEYRYDFELVEVNK